MHMRTGVYIHRTYTVHACVSLVQHRLYTCTWIAPSIMTVCTCIVRMINSRVQCDSDLCTSTLRSTCILHTEVVGYFTKSCEPEDSLLSSLLSPWFFLLQAVLAAIIWVALYGMFSQVVDIWRYFKLSVWDMVSSCVCTI